MIVLKVTGLGYYRGDSRTLLQKVAMYSALISGSTLGNNFIYNKSEEMSKFNSAAGSNRESNEAISGLRTGKSQGQGVIKAKDSFNPIDAYLKTFFD